jgi:Holliday junction DNA helicase RuvB
MSTATMAGTGQYVNSWDEYVGQPKAKAQLRAAINAAKTRGRRLDHTLLASGHAGLGKTTLALLIADEMGVPCEVVSGKLGLNEARYLIGDMEDGSILFIDEVHRLVNGGKQNAEWLLHLLQDGVLMGPCGAEEMPNITVVAATTDVGRLPVPILDRFPLRPVLEAYTEAEAVLIAILTGTAKFAGTGLPQPNRATCERVARAAVRNPRRIGTIFTNLVNDALGNEGANWDEENGYDLTSVLSWMGLSEDGLTDLAQRYLIALRSTPEGLGKAALAEMLREPGGLSDTETLLGDAELIAFTKQGRVLTAAGRRRATALRNERATS